MVSKGRSKRTKCRGLFKAAMIWMRLVAKPITRLGDAGDLGSCLINILYRNHDGRQIEGKSRL